MKPAPDSAHPFPRPGATEAARRCKALSGLCLRLCIGLTAAFSSAPAWAAGPPVSSAVGPSISPSARLAPALQAELDAAVADHSAGRREQALAAMRSLAQRGVPAARYNLGLMHLRGEVPMPDRVEAERLLLSAAEAGFVTAQALLGQAYEQGRIGAVPGQKNLEQAHRWYETAALAGSVDAQVAMGTAYFLGRGRPKDWALALQWYREAAKGGDVGAMYITASMYEHGDGVEADLRLARYWYEQAARLGDEAAPGKLKEVEAKQALGAGV